MSAVLGEESAPLSLPPDIPACAARRRRAADAARRRTVGGLLSDIVARPPTTARKSDTFSIFQTEAEGEELSYTDPPEPPTTSTGRRTGSELRRHHSVAAPSVGEKLRKFNIDLFNYGSYLSRRLYLPEKDSTLETDDAEAGQRCGPWYDLWAADASCTPSGTQVRRAGTARVQYWYGVGTALG